VVQADKKEEGDDHKQEGHHKVKGHHMEEGREDKREGPHHMGEEQEVHGDTLTQEVAYWGPWEGCICLEAALQWAEQKVACHMGLWVDCALLEVLQS